MLSRTTRIQAKFKVWLAFLVLSYFHLTHEGVVRSGLFSLRFWAPLLAWACLLHILIGWLCDSCQRGKRSAGAVGRVLYWLGRLALLLLLGTSLLLFWNREELRQSGHFGRCWLRPILFDVLSPFQAAHFQRSKAEYLARGRYNNHQTGRQRKEYEFDKVEPRNNECVNYAFRNLYESIAQSDLDPKMEYHELPVIAPLQPYMSLTAQQLAANYHLGHAKPYYVSLICQLSVHELPYVKEFVTFHLAAGIDHIFLYESLDVAAMRTELADYVTTEQVTVVDWSDPKYEHAYVNQDGQENLNQTVRSAGLAQQSNALAHAINNYRNKTFWLLHLDSDEYAMSTDTSGGRYAFRRALSRLAELGYCEVQIPRYEFGSSGHIQKPAGAVASSYMRSEYLFSAAVKSVAWMDYLATDTPLSPHCFQFKPEYRSRCRRLWAGVWTSYGQWLRPISAQQEPRCL
eukprot:g48692.t1